MQPAAPRPTIPSPVATPRWLQVAFVFAVIAFAWLRFSDNTVDNDLWGHVLYGQRAWNQGQVRGPEVLSWTANGFDIVNHEYLAEIVMGGVHRLGGGSGLWIYMMVMAALTVVIAWRAGRGSSPAEKWTSLALLAASVNFIAVGFALRPQLFSTLALVLELILLRRIVNGRFWWGLLLPLLIALWGNLHGGVLAGVIVFLVLAGMESVHALWPRPWGPGWEATRPPRRNLAVYGLLFVPVALALLLNPWGYGLVQWNISAVLRPRPQIHEWHALALSAAHAPFYIVAAVSALAWIFSRQPKKAWEAATLLLLAAMGVMHQRHVPLFGLANLILTPRHLADAARRIAPHCRSLVAALARPRVQAGAAAALLLGGGVCLAASFGAPREHPFTMEVEKSVYPVAAVEFIQAHRLFGKTITFFDWGQENLWALPHNPVSFDGRFDTGYPPAISAAHWDFYGGKAMGPAVRWSEAELALLPTGSGGAGLLMQAGWRSVYRDPLASVLVPPSGRHAAFMAGEAPLQRGREALRGREPFPDAPALLATPGAPR